MEKQFFKVKVPLSWWGHSHSDTRESLWLWVDWFWCWRKWLIYNGKTDYDGRKSISLIHNSQEVTSIPKKTPKIWLVNSFCNLTCIKYLLLVIYTRNLQINDHFNEHHMKDLPISVLNTRFLAFCITNWKIIPLKCIVFSKLFS